MGQSMLVFRCHHCICDGITFGEIWLHLSDGFEEQTPVALARPPPIKKKSVYSVCSKLRAFLIYIVGTLYVLLKVVAFTMQREPQTSLKRELGQRKCVSYVSDTFSLRDINRLRRGIGFAGKRRCPTFNDYMMAILAEALKLHFERREEEVPPSVRLGIPVNVRGRRLLSSDVELGNKIGSLVLSLPTDKNLHFLQRLEAVQSAMDAIKATPEALMSHYAMKALSCLPQRVVDSMAPRMSGGLSLVASNVRFPRKLAICGADVGDVIGIVPPPMGVALGVAILTLNDDKVVVTVNVDANCGGADTAKHLIQCFKQAVQQQMDDGQHDKGRRSKCLNLFA